jgi:hypothetical protein
MPLGVHVDLFRMLPCTILEKFQPADANPLHLHYGTFLGIETPMVVAKTIKVLDSLVPADTN